MLTIALVYGHKHGSLVAWVGSSCRFITQRALVSPLESPVSPVTNFLSILDMNSLMWLEHQIQSEVNCSSLWQTYHGFSSELLLPAQTALLHSIFSWAKLEMTISPSFMPSSEGMGASQQRGNFPLHFSLTSLCAVTKAFGQAIGSY